MSTMEIILLVVGAAVFIVSFFVPDRSDKGKRSGHVDEKAIDKMLKEKMDEARDRISDMVDETVQYAVEKSERSMDRVSNEKMLAINEYSDSVLGQIDKNHQEILFLYDMLNDKSVDLKNTVREATQVEKSVQVVPEPLVEVDTIETQPDEGPISVIDAKPRKRTTPKKTAKKASGMDITFDALSSQGKGNKNKNDRILELHRQGKSNIEVARELGLGMGEVKLVIDLFEGAK